MTAQLHCPGVWPQSSLHAAVKVFVDEINIYISRLSKAHHPPYGGWASHNQLQTLRAKTEVFQRRNSPEDNNIKTLPGFPCQPALQILDLTAPSIM